MKRAKGALMSHKSQLTPYIHNHRPGCREGGHVRGKFEGANEKKIGGKEAGRGKKKKEEGREKESRELRRRKGEERERRKGGRKERRMGRGSERKKKRERLR